MTDFDRIKAANAADEFLAINGVKLTDGELAATHKLSEYIWEMCLQDVRVYTTVDAIANELLDDEDCVLGSIN